jgi:hypothetical protein
MSWAQVLIEIMPWAAVSRAAIFTVLVLFLYVEDSDTLLGKWISRFFVCTACANWMTAWLTFYLVARSQDGVSLSIEQWFLVLGLNIFPILTAITGVMVAYYTVEEQKTRMQDADEVLGLP